MSNFLKVVLVDGEKVRDLFKSDYIEGGHHYVYPWIPIGEIWIEDTINASEMPPIVLHEFVERELMKRRGLTYPHAHTIASKVEFAHETITKAAVLALSSEDALALADAATGRKSKAASAWGLNRLSLGRRRIRELALLNGHGHLNEYHVKGEEQGKPCTPGHTASRDECIPVRDDTGKVVEGGGETSETHHPVPDSDLVALYERVMKPDGGFTYNTVTADQPVEGYALSPYPARSFAKSASELSPVDIATYAVHNEDVLEQPDHYIGAWHDPASGKVFLDVSVVKKDADEAHELCLKHDQIAYFDLKAGKSVTVNASATSGGVKGVRNGRTADGKRISAGSKANPYAHPRQAEARSDHGIVSSPDGTRCDSRRNRAVPSGHRGPRGQEAFAKDLSGKPCEQGQSATRSGCIPADRDSTGKVTSKPADAGESKPADTPPAPTQFPPPTNLAELHAQADQKATESISLFTAVMEKVSNAPFIRHVRKMGQVLKAWTKKYHAALTKRYGRKTANAVMASGVMAAWGPTAVGAMLGVPIVGLPGQTILGSLPGVALAEIYKQVRKRLKKAIEELMSEDDDGVDLDAIKKLTVEMQEQLRDVFQAYILEHREELQAAIEEMGELPGDTEGTQADAKVDEQPPAAKPPSSPAPDVPPGKRGLARLKSRVSGASHAARAKDTLGKKPDTSQSEARGKPCEQGQSAARTGCVPARDDTGKVTDGSGSGDGKPDAAETPADAQPDASGKPAAGGAAPHDAPAQLNQLLADLSKPAGEDRAKPGADGKPTEGEKPADQGDLTPQEDYKQNGTEAKAFKEWFGNSAVVDTEGKPEVNHNLTENAVAVDEDAPPVIMYHGTPRGEFEEFDPKKLRHADNLVFGDGFYFTADEKLAERYANDEHALPQGQEHAKPHIFKVYLKIEKPFRMDKSYSKEEFEEVTGKKVGLFGRIGRAMSGKDTSKYSSDEVYGALVTSQGGRMAANARLKSLGYDGIHTKELNGEHVNVWVAFKPEAIKSVENEGSFDPNDANIKKELQ
jgi:ADP-Ribosyltransferase in polyvalent proteins